MPITPLLTSSNIDIYITWLSAGAMKTPFQVQISKAQQIVTKKIPADMIRSRIFVMEYQNTNPQSTTNHEIKVDIKPVDNTPLRCSLTKDFAHILTSKEFSDVTVVAPYGAKFKVHKLILCARSQVFAAMFRNDSQESKTNLIRIDDMDAEVIEEMLKFMYTCGNIPEKMAAELFIAANKYSLLDLQTLCEDILIETMEVATVADILLLADRHANERLKTTAVQFIVNNIKTVKSTECLKKLHKTDHELCFYVLEKTIEERL
ncbi:speckle-type POZ protein-like [Musca autumnalis]|uniref:speckle-type POZ protein-like n=1 Tax=Musca autumnalis TaxID=221902 RepID=UPI003CF77FC9